jgi:hypothetical protein
MDCLFHNSYLTPLRELLRRGARRRRSHLAGHILGMLACLVVFPFSSRADSLDLALTSSVASGQPGGTVVFSGVITNTTGIDLSSTDLFLNFAGFDPTNLDVNQILGSTIFSLPNFTFSPNVDLFSVAIAAGAPAGIYTFQAQLEDINNDVSKVETVSVDVLRSNAVSEPSSGLLLICGLVALCVLTGLRKV